MVGGGLHEVGGFPTVYISLFLRGGGLNKILLKYMGGGGGGVAYKKGWLTRANTVDNTVSSLVSAPC